MIEVNFNNVADYTTESSSVLVSQSKKLDAAANYIGLLIKGES